MSGMGPLDALWHDLDADQRAPVLAVLARLAKLPLFANLDYRLRAAITKRLEWLSVPAATVLCVQGEPADALYVLLHGRLAVSRDDGHGQVRTLASVEPGETIGEHALVADTPYPAQIETVRDSEVLRLSRAQYQALLRDYPQAMFDLAQIALRRQALPRERPLVPRCIAVLPCHRGIDAERFAQRLARAFGTDPASALVLQSQAHGQDAGWYSAREDGSPALFYVGNDDPEWRARCARQSDWVLLLARASADPGNVWSLPPAVPHVPQHLVLLHADGKASGRARAWRDALAQASDAHHVRRDEDIARIARRLQGRALGLVLSGGGARGFAHLGVIRALREAGLDIDYIGGTSIGAIVGSAIAAGWDQDLVEATHRRVFVETNPLSDWTLPLLALCRGERVANLLRQEHGEHDIEDLPIPFFCVSSDLSVGRLHVHDSGCLWRALRATCAIPGLLPPVFEHGRVLVDGGVIENLPVETLRRRMLGPIIASDVGGSFLLNCELDETYTPPWWQVLFERWRGRRRPGIAQLLLRAGMVSSNAAAHRQRRMCRLVLQPPLDDIGLLSWHQFDRAIDIGYHYTLERLEHEPNLLTRLRMPVSSA